MNLRSTSSVTSVESEDYLEFTSKRDDGWIAFLLGPVFCFVLVAISWHFKSWPLLLVFGLGLAVVLFQWSWQSICRVSVNSRELLVTADLKDYPNRVVRYAPHAVTSLRYWLGDEGESSGLYINTDCIIPRISEEEANQIATLIVLKFPQYNGNDTTRTSLLHGEDSGITLLGLSHKPEPSESATHANS